MKTLLAGGVGELITRIAETVKEKLVADSMICTSMASARAKGRKGGHPYKMTPAKLRLAMASLGDNLKLELGL